MELRAMRLDPGMAREYRFHDRRQWRFDFAWPAELLAVEVEGLTHAGGRHQRPAGFADDCRKYNTAAIAGWRVLRFTQTMISSGEAVDTIKATRTKTK